MLKGLCPHALMLINTPLFYLAISKKTLPGTGWRRPIGCLKVGLGIFDFCTHSRRLISKDSISSPNFSCGCSYAECALWCRDSKCRALGNYFPVRIYYEFLISKCRVDWLLFLYPSFFFFHPFSDGKIRFFSAGETRFFSEAAFTQRFSFRKHPKSAQT